MGCLWLVGAWGMLAGRCQMVAYRLFSVLFLFPFLDYPRLLSLSSIIQSSQIPSVSAGGTFTILYHAVHAMFSIFIGSEPLTSASSVWRLMMAVTLYCKY